MKTYQDLLEVGRDEKARMDFILAAINEHKSSQLYKTAVDAELYYDGENPTINKLEKIIHDINGQPHKDLWTANHKIASSFFKFVVWQENGYLLGNGVTFQNDDTKDKLGNRQFEFDRQVFEAGKNAIIHGVTYGFWNLDHVEIFTVKEFAPLYDEENGAMMAGVRFWQLAPDKPLRVTLFEPDGYTEYIRRNGEDMQIKADKRAYILRMTGDALGKASGDVIYHGENYPSFPIVPLMYDSNQKSEICGKRNTIDALDLVSSQMINNVDEGNVIYWVLKNYGGMDDIDRQKFIEQIKTTHVANVDNDGEVEAHTMEAPVVGTQAAIDELKATLHSNFMTFNSQTLSAGPMAAVQIDSAYSDLDLKVDNFEPNVTDFIMRIEALAGIDDKPTYTRNKIKNQTEYIQSLLLLAQYLSPEYIVKSGLAALGDIDAVDGVLDQVDVENFGRFVGGDNTPQD